MKTKLLYIITFLFGIHNFAQTNTCGTSVNNTFEEAGVLPAGWTEYNTTGRVTVEEGKLKFNHNIEMPSVYHTFSPTSSNSTFSFDVSATRSSVDCRVHLTSSTGKYLSTIILGNGKANIEYATSIENGVPGGFVAGEPATRFPANTNFTISTQVDFASQKVDISVNGELMTADVSFLEEAEDIAKIDIELLSMHNNTGQFYFDNISLLGGEENRLLLTSNVNAAESLLSSASIGTIFNQYPQSAVDAFQLAINNVNSLLSDCNSTSDSIDASILELKEAQDVFNASRVNDPVLKLYADYDFSGEEHEVFPGYYNGGLGAYEDWGVSFTLEQGYMVTFAADVNGLGFSKIYIAQDNALEINLPADLQNTISFIRVSPWYPVGKKGSIGGDIKWSNAENYNTTWHYSWGLTEQKSEGVQFVPMSWSGGEARTSLEAMEEVGQNMSFNHLLAFNEPDNSDQSNMTVAEALEAYPKLLASGLRLGAPGVENVQYSATSDTFNDGAWIQEFMDGCIERGYRVDFIPAHDYVRRSKSTFLERFKALHDRYDLPVWVTEYNYGNPNMGSANLTVEQGYSNIKGLTEVLEEADFIERYNWYYFFGSATGIGGVTDGELNITGQFYRDLESQNPSYIQEEYEQGAQLSVDDNSVLSNVLMFPTVITDGFFNLKYPEEFKNSTINIYSTVGQLVKKISGLKSKIDVKTLSSGLYIVKIESHLGNFTKKIIIQ